MKFRILACLVLSVLVLNLGASGFADTKAKRSGANDLVTLLPASDGVVTLDVKRFFGDALPRLLASNQPMLEKITAHMDQLQEKSGIDIRQFEYVAAGTTTRKVADKDYDIDAVILARGQMSAAALIGAAKLASKAKYTEEHVGERTIYIFDSSAVMSTTPHTKAPDKLAVAVVDSVTVAFGSPTRVRQTLEGRTKVSSDIVALLDRTPNSVTSFASKLPAGMKSFMPLANDELGKNIDSIQYVYGNADVAADNASVHMTARTLQNAQAKSLHETLSGLQMFGKGILGGSKDPNRQAYARMVENAKFTVRGNEVTLDLTVPQSDIDIVVGKLK